MDALYEYYEHLFSFRGVLCAAAAAGDPNAAAPHRARPWPRLTPLRTADKRMDGWLFMDSPTPTIVLTIAYLLIVHYGSKHMRSWLGCVPCRS